MVGYSDKTTKTTVTGLETFRKTLESGEAGDNCGVLLRGIQRDDVFRGQCLAKPGTLKLVRNFTASVYILKEEEGGRKKSIASGYRP